VIVVLHDCCVARLRDCCVTRLHDCCVARLRDCCVEHCVIVVLQGCVISGNKMNDIEVFYTLWSNLKKTNGMVIKKVI
jgi:hypothetical protein